MSQWRVFASLPANLARTTGDRLEAEFEADGHPVAVFESDETHGIWTASVYCAAEDAAEVEIRMRAALSENGIDDFPQREEIVEEDWVTRTLEGLAPVRAGRFVVHGSHDRGCARANEFAILIDAAMAFGTGHHGTTAGCLQMIGEALKHRRVTNALDLGSGTGILAIAIARAVRIPVLASDIDPVAARIARENARLNGAGGLIHSITAAGFRHPAFGARGPFDLIVANILAGPLQAMAPGIARHAAPGATIILSGLLPHQKARIVSACRLQGMHLRKAHYRDGWMTLVLGKGN